MAAATAPIRATDHAHDCVVEVSAPGAETLAARWETGYAAAALWHRTHAGPIPRTEVTADGYRLGRWVHTQRSRYRAGTLDPDRAARLNELPGWVWSVYDTRWEVGYAAAEQWLREHKGYYGTIPLIEVTADGYRIGRWARDQRDEAGAGTLDPIRVARLNLLPGWEWLDVRLHDRWEPCGAPWERGYATVRKFVAEHGHARVPINRVMDGYPLGRWVYGQRCSHFTARLAGTDRYGALTPARAAILDSLPGWDWNSQH